MQVEPKGAGALEDNATDTLPVYSEQAKADLWLFFSPLQDVDIFVEDDSQEEHYNLLFSKLAIFSNDFRFMRVFGLGGFDSVIQQSNALDRSRCRIFIVDGDLRYAVQTTNPADDRVYSHECYCIENILVNKDAVTEILYEELGGECRKVAEELMDWDSFISDIEEKLVPLFVVYAAVNSLHPSIKTVRRGLGKVCCSIDGSRAISEDRLEVEINAIKTEALQHIDSNLLSDQIHRVDERVNCLEDKTAIVSGKDYILPLLIDRMRMLCKHHIDQKSVCFRLAKNCNAHHLSGIETHIQRNREIFARR